MFFPVLLVLFIVLPLAELALLIKVGGWMGAGNTIALVVVTGFVGATLARREGLKVLGHIQADLNQGKMPAPYILDGLMILVAAVLLITPGLVTDVVGFLLLVPACRLVVKGWLRKVLERKLRNRSAEVTYWEW